MDRLTLGLRVKSDEDMMREFGKMKSDQRKRPSPWEKIPKVYSKLDKTPLPVLTVPTSGPLNINLDSKAGD